MRSRELALRESSELRENLDFLADWRSLNLMHTIKVVNRYHYPQSLFRQTGARRLSVPQSQY